MRFTYKPTSKISVEFDADDIKDGVEKLYHLQEILEQYRCGKCKKGNVRFVVRENDENKFYEIRCLSCKAKLELGVHKKGGTLFPKRKDKDGKYLDNDGWIVWEGYKNAST